MYTSSDQRQRVDANINVPRFHRSNQIADERSRKHGLAIYKSANVNAYPFRILLVIPGALRIRSQLGSDNSQRQIGPVI